MLGGACYGGMRADTPHTAHGHWITELEPAEAMPALEGHVDADIVIIGGGYTGMWAAWWITEHDPAARVVLLEAGRCGTGPSGRNGGFVLPLWMSLPTLRERFGDEAALATCLASQDSVDAIGAWCTEQAVDASFTPSGYLQTSTVPGHDGAWDEVVRSCRDLGEPDACRPQTAAEVSARCASPRFRGGAFYPSAATVQPAQLAAGLRARLADRIVIHEASAVNSLHAGPTSVVRTDRGEVSAGAVVLAVGSAAARLHPLRTRLTVTSSHMVVTEPVPDVLDELGWTDGECITDSRAMVHYFRTTRDGRIAFGWGGGQIALGTRLGGRAEVDPELAPEVARHLVEFFPQLAGRRIDHAWGGPIDVSPTHLPVIGSLTPDSVHYAFGFTGNGVGPSQLAGRILAARALGRDDPETRLAIVDPPAVHVPPEPLRYAGGTVVRRALLRKERLEEEGRRPDLATRAIAALPSLIGIHIGR